MVCHDRSFGVPHHAAAFAAVGQHGDDRGLDLPYHLRDVPNTPRSTVASGAGRERRSGHDRRLPGPHGAIAGIARGADQVTGPIKGTLDQLTTLVGTLAGRLRGSILEGLFPEQPNVTVRWYVENERNRALKHGTDYLIKGLPPQRPTSW